MEKKLKNFKLDPTLKWEFAEIKEINNSLIKFNLIDKKMKSQQEGTLNLKGGEVGLFQIRKK